MLDIEFLYHKSSELNSLFLHYPDYIIKSSVLGVVGHIIIKNKPPKLSNNTLTQMDFPCLVESIGLVTRSGHLNMCMTFLMGLSDQIMTFLLQCHPSPEGPNVTFMISFMVLRKRWQEHPTFPLGLIPKETVQC